MDDDRYQSGQRVALAGMSVSAVLACVNIAAGLVSQSTSVVAAGLEFAGDVVASAVVLLGMRVGSRPPDADHPYGHGRAETLAAFVVALILVGAGGMISYHSLQAIGARHAPPGG